jgi:hypothetical protein
MAMPFVLTLVLVTSALAYLITRRQQPLPTRSLLTAFGALLDWAGLFALFTSANLAIGTVLILLIRGFTPRFVSLYELESVFLLIFSGVQAFVFHQWSKLA